MPGWYGVSNVKWLTHIRAQAERFLGKYQARWYRTLWAEEIDGETIWHEKLGADQLHASPLYADGKLYVPMWHDGLYIIEPGDDGGPVIHRIRIRKT